MENIETAILGDDLRSLFGEVQKDDELERLAALAEEALAMLQDDA